jgi:hypothetical protein
MHRGFLAILALVFGLSGLVPVVESPTAQAAPVVVFDGSPGTSAPPATLGPYLITPFGDDTRSDFSNVNGVAVANGAPPGGAINFNVPLSKRSIPASWLTWSHGYAGDVYTLETGTTVTIVMPADTRAFRFYAQPDDFDTYVITATAHDGTTSGPIPVAGFEGAHYFGFYATDATLATVKVELTNPAANGFAIGELGIGLGNVRRDSSVVKSVAPTGGVAPGDVVTFTVNIQVGSVKNNAVLQDIFTGGGMAPDTSYVAGSATCTPAPCAAAPQAVLASNQLNRVVYHFQLGNLAPGNYTLTYQWRIAPQERIGCYAQVNNGVNLNVAGTSDHLNTSSVGVAVRCR